MTKQKKTVSVYDDAEIAEILGKAQQQNPVALSLAQTVDENEGFLLTPITGIQDPEKAYELYYKIYQGFLREFLPKGSGDAADIRKIIRLEGNLYLKQGNKKGRDSRQAYLHHLTKICNTIIEWINKTNGSDPVMLYNNFKELNTENSISEAKGI